MLDSVIKANKRYYFKRLLEEWKYVQEKIKIENRIDEDLDESEKDSDGETEFELLIIIIIIIIIIIKT